MIFTSFHSSCKLKSRREDAVLQFQAQADSKTVPWSGPKFLKYDFGIEIYRMLEKKGLLERYKIRKLTKLKLDVLFRDVDILPALKGRDSSSNNHAKHD